MCILMIKPCNFDVSRETKMFEDVALNRLTVNAFRTKPREMVSSSK